jgi:hypothetical protein
MVIINAIRVPIFIVIGIIGLVILPSSLSAKITCTTTFECAQVAVEAAERAEAAVSALQDKVSKLHNLGP